MTPKPAPYRTARALNPLNPKPQTLKPRAQPLTPASCVRKCGATENLQLSEQASYLNPMKLTLSPRRQPGPWWRNSGCIRTGFGELLLPRTCSSKFRWEASDTPCEPKNALGIDELVLRVWSVGAFTNLKHSAQTPGARQQTFFLRYRCECTFRVSTFSGVLCCVIATEDSNSFFLDA